MLSLDFTLHYIFAFIFNHIFFKTPTVFLKSKNKQFRHYTFLGICYLKEYLLHTYGMETDFMDRWTDRASASVLFGVQWLTSVAVFRTIQLVPVCARPDQSIPERSN